MSSTCALWDVSSCMFYFDAPNLHQASASHLLASFWLQEITSSSARDRVRNCSSTSYPHTSGNENTGASMLFYASALGQVGQSVAAAVCCNFYGRGSMVEASSEGVEEVLVFIPPSRLPTFSHFTPYPLLSVPVSGERVAEVLLFIPLLPSSPPPLPTLTPTPLPPPLPHLLLPPLRLLSFLSVPVLHSL